MYNSSFVMKCHNSGFSDDYSYLQGESVWEKRETSLSIEEVKEPKLCQMSDCQEMKWLPACSLLVWQKKKWFCEDFEHSCVENMTIHNVHLSLTLLSFIK